jgi:hypothetical protein
MAGYGDEVAPVPGTCGSFARRRDGDVPAFREPGTSTLIRTRSRCRQGGEEFQLLCRGHWITAVENGQGDHRQGWAGQVARGT